MSDFLHTPKPGSAAARAKAEVEKQAAEQKAREELLAKEIAAAKKEDRKIRRQFRHDWAVAITSAVVGALISRPVWAGIDALILLITRLSEQ